MLDAVADRELRLRSERRASAWAAVFAALAVLHLAVLPHVFGERLDERIAEAAGLVYLALAAWQWSRARRLSP
jgi:hypothetical protein